MKTIFQNMRLFQQLYRTPQNMTQIKFAQYFYLRHEYIVIKKQITLPLLQLKISNRLVPDDYNKRFIYNRSIEESIIKHDTFVVLSSQESKCIYRSKNVNKKRDTIEQIIKHFAKSNQTYFIQLALANYFIEQVQNFYLCILLSELAKQLILALDEMGSLDQQKIKKLHLLNPNDQIIKSIESLNTKTKELYTLQQILSSAVFPLYSWNQLLLKYRMISLQQLSSSELGIQIYAYYLYSQPNKKCLLEDISMLNKSLNEFDFSRFFDTYEQNKKVSYFYQLRYLKLLPFKDLDIKKGIYCLVIFVKSYSVSDLRVLVENLNNLR